MLSQRLRVGRKLGRARSVSNSIKPSCASGLTSVLLFFQLPDGQRPDGQHLRLRLLFWLRLVRPEWLPARRCSALRFAAELDKLPRSLLPQTAEYHDLSDHSSSPKGT